ncbi:unnamed protein product [Euphydryas editha]|uniref:Uncharacterized protein n=1 Tax=Euphydryas editha TaxID=104508 RepID=A0AAU9V4W2_EUPED|nr:unnamed protein product [Euphydryas editha]
MNWSILNILKFLKRLFNQKDSKRRNMYNLKRRRESVALVYRKTTKFLSSNTANFLKKTPNTKKYNLLARIVEEYQKNNDKDNKNCDEKDDNDSINDLGERDLDYYLGVREKVTYWRDPEGNEKIRKDYLLYHCGITEEDYEKNYKRTIVPRATYPVHPKLKQVPFKIHKKEKKVNSFKEGVTESWVEKKGIFKLFGNRRDSDTTSDSYSECDSNEEAKYIDDIDYDKDDNEEIIWNVTNNFNDLTTIDALNKLLGVRIKEVSEGRPCDNCPELCPGFISHPWRSVILFILIFILRIFSFKETLRIVDIIVDQKENITSLIVRSELRAFNSPSAYSSLFIVNRVLTASRRVTDKYVSVVETTRVGGNIPPRDQTRQGRCSGEEDTEVSVEGEELCGPAKEQQQQSQITRELPNLC